MLHRSKSVSIVDTTSVDEIDDDLFSTSFLPSTIYRENAGVTILERSQSI